MNKEKIIEILNSEILPATGCTEPGALAYAAAVAAAYLGGEAPESITVLASRNVFKNAMGAGIPGTGLTGMEYAAALGAFGGDPKRELQVLKDISPEALRRAKSFVEDKKVRVGIADTLEKVYIDITLKGKTSASQAVISGTHTNIILIKQNGRTVKCSESSEAGTDLSFETIKSILSVSSCYEFAEALDTENDPIDVIRSCIAANRAISEEGLKNDYGLRIGKTLREEMDEGLIGDSLVTYATLMTAAGADARMSGASFTVFSNSGSGNQGIAVTMPVVAVAERIGASEDRTLRAVALSNLITIYIKSKFGRLSAYCGATVAGMGAACGAAYLLGGGLEAIEAAIRNMIGDVTGMLCDGAKADCALKISTCTNAALHSALMAVRGISVQKTDGIVSESVEESIENFAALGNRGSACIDPLVLEMMLNKK